MKCLRGLMELILEHNKANIPGPLRSGHLFCVDASALHRLASLAQQPFSRKDYVSLNPELSSINSGQGT